MAVFQQREQQQKLPIHRKGSPSISKGKVRPFTQIIKRSGVHINWADNNRTLRIIMQTVTFGRVKNPNQQRRAQNILAETPVRLYCRTVKESFVGTVQLGY
jgi:hypothetical protein